MPLSVQDIDPQYVADKADALDEWMLCPYTRQALLNWVERELMLWALIRRDRPDLDDDAVLNMLRHQYQRWIYSHCELPPDTPCRSCRR